MQSLLSDESAKSTTWFTVCFIYRVNPLCLAMTMITYNLRWLTGGGSLEKWLMDLKTLIMTMFWENISNSSNDISKWSTIYSRDCNALKMATISFLVTCTDTKNIWSHKQTHPLASEPPGSLQCFWSKAKKADTVNIIIQLLEKIREELDQWLVYF